MNSLFNLLLLLICLCRAADHTAWLDELQTETEDGMEGVVGYYEEIPERITVAVREERVDDIFAFIDEFPGAKGLLSAISKSKSLDLTHYLSGYLKNRGYVPVKNEVAEAFVNILKITLNSSDTEKLLEKWGDSLDYSSIREMILACASLNEPVPALLINIINSSKQTLFLAGRLISLIEKVISINRDPSLIYTLSPFFGMTPERIGEKYWEIRASSRISRITLELEGKRERLKNVDLGSAADMEDYLERGSMEDLFEVAVKSDKADAVSFLISNGADPFALDTVTGEPLSSLPTCSLATRQILLRAQASLLFPKLRAMIQTELVMDVVSEMYKKLADLEFAERRAHLLL